MSDKTGIEWTKSPDGTKGQTVLIGSVPTTTEGWIDQLYHDLFELRRLASPANAN